MKRRDFVKSLPILAVAPSILSYTQKEEIHLVALGTAASKLIGRSSDNLKVDSITFITDKRPRISKMNCEFIQFAPPNSAYDYYGGFRFLKKEIPMQLELSDQIKQRLDSLKGRVILIAGLGKFTGTFMYSPITNYLDSKGFKTEGLCSLPFEFEGGFWRKASIKTASSIQGNQKVLDFEQIRKQKGNVSIRSAFEYADDWMLGVLRIML
ncbi:hypothetical protein Belba_0508 [Belliella baltica DSM 15883]|uniref:Uncharacterized protein n=1 Tax=Belliella baltica (strain DSM 15883 / CIP 108006 / LMG 21964 / BA134) TaxID=866536 RepID=I3Z1P8_BELBD|nr:hypothetical protein [Belliella baltica]AFL83166.1 hypothetical protein Belba_0508 [Belliella baltica DSM 15883]